MNSDEKQKLDLLFGRRSIRAFKPGDIGPQTTQLLLEAAMAAPSAAAKDPWRFVVIRERETLQQIATVLPNGKMLASAALGIVVCGDLKSAHDSRLSYLLQDCSAAIENLLLAAHAMKLGACWLGVHPRVPRVRDMRTILGLPAHVIPVACVALGHPDERKDSRTRFDSTYVHYEKW